MKTHRSCAIDVDNYFVAGNLLGVRNVQDLEIAPVAEQQMVNEIALAVGTVPVVM